MTDTDKNFNHIRFIGLAIAITLAIWAKHVDAQDASTVTDANETVDTSYIAQKYEVDPADDLAARQVIARLNHALDAADYDLYGSFYAAEGVFESDFGDAVGPKQVAAALEQVRPFITNRRHVAANHVISRTGDQLVVTTYLIVYERVAALEYVGSAVNTDTLEMRDGSWKVVRHASELDPATKAYIQNLMQNGGQ